MARKDAGAAAAQDAQTKEKGKSSNRPENTKFKQQKLDAWQPILTPAWVIGTFLLVGCVFVPVGAYLFKLSDDLFESVVTYDSYQSSDLSAGVSDDCRITSINEGYERIQDGTADFGSCALTVEVTQDIDEGDTLFLYYQISNFYQNHRRYVKSVSESQLTNDVTINPVTSMSNNALETACDPEESFENEDFFDRIYYPCGLIALSVFNDGIALRRFERPGTGTVEYAAGVPTSGPESLRITLRTDNIAWSSDLDNKFRNPTATGCSLMTASNVGGNLCPARYFQYQYLWQTYDQFLCYPADGAVADAPDLSQPLAPCDDYTTYVNALGAEAHGAGAWNSFAAANNLNATFFGSGCARCTNDADVLVSAGGVRPPADPSSATSRDGLRDERFIVWMRTAGLPTFRKLFGRFSAPQGGLKSGDKITLNVVPNFLVSEIEGTKALVLGTTSPLGGKNDVLGIAYMSVGAICLVLAAVFALKQKLNPRRLGDPSYLAFAQGGQQQQQQQDAAQQQGDAHHVD